MINCAHMCSEAMRSEGEGQSRMIEERGTIPFQQHHRLSRRTAFKMSCQLACLWLHGVQFIGVIGTWHVSPAPNEKGDCWLLTPMPMPVQYEP